MAYALKSSLCRSSSVATRPRIVAFSHLLVLGHRVVLKDFALEDPDLDAAGAERGERGRHARGGLQRLERGQRVDAAILRTAMEAAFGASDASGAWDWKTAYDACEAATVLFLRKYGKALFRKADSPASRLSGLTKIAGLLPTHTRRSAESEAFQQFSTPTPLGFAALTAAAFFAEVSLAAALR